MKLSTQLLVSFHLFLLLICSTVSEKNMVVLKRLKETKVEVKSAMNPQSNGFQLFLCLFTLSTSSKRDILLRKVAHSFETLYNVQKLSQHLHDFK